MAKKKAGKSVSIGCDPGQQAAEAGSAGAVTLTIDTQKVTTKNQLLRCIDTLRLAASNRDYP